MDNTAQTRDNTSSDAVVSGEIKLRGHEGHGQLQLSKSQLLQACVEEISPRCPARVCTHRPLDRGDREKLTTATPLQTNENFKTVPSHIPDLAGRSLRKRTSKIIGEYLRSVVKGTGENLVPIGVEIQ